MPDKDDIESIRLLTNRFFEGETTLDEEIELYILYVTTPSECLPTDIADKRQSIIYLIGDLPFNSAHISEGSIKDKSNLNIRFRISKWITVAAMLAITIYIGINLSAHNKSFNNAYTQYAGSYIIDSGARVSEIKEIYPKLVVTEIESATNNSIISDIYTITDETASVNEYLRIMSLIDKVN